MSVILPFDQGTLTAFLLALVRALAWVFMVVPFGLRAMPLITKVGLGAALAMAAVPSLEAGPLPTDVAGLTGAAIVQTLVGVTLGLVVVVSFSAVQAAGSLIDDFAGFNLAAMMDPMASASAGPFGRLYQMIAIALLFASDLYLILVRGFLRSFEAVRGMRLGEILDLFMSNLGQLVVASLEIAGPVLLVLFLTEVAFGLLARTAPQMNVFILAFPARVLVALIATVAALPLVVPAVDHLVSAAVRDLLAL
jgi:flagellar biosynthetic protein FliR